MGAIPFPADAGEGIFFGQFSAAALTFS